MRYLRQAPIIALLAAAPAAAFQPPAGCEGILTVQYDGCLMSHIWRCEADAPGEQWVGLFGKEGAMQLRKVDREFQWLETFYFNPPATELMQVPAPDPESLDELFENKEDLYDFTITSGDVAVRYKGYDRLTGETVVIDGETLLRTEFGYEATGADGELLRARSGRQYVSEEYRLFFFGSVWNTDDPETVEETSPRRFARPGDEGFMADEPAFGCSPLMSGSVIGGAA